MDPKAKTGSPDPKIKIQEHNPLLYWTIFFGTIGTWLGLVSVGLNTIDVGPQGFGIGVPIILGVIVHFLLSWGSVDKDEWGEFYFYGRALRSAKPGPYLRPLGLMQIEKAPKKQQQFQAPGEPEQIFHGGDKEPLPKGMVRPIRITTRAPKPEEKEHLDVQMTAEWSFYVRFQILNPLGFFEAVGSFDEAMRIIRDTGEAILNEFASDRTMGGMIRDLEQINSALDDRIRELVNSWFMEIFEAKALAPNLSKTLSEELRNVPVTRLRAEQTRETAAATRVKLQEEGEGEAAAILAKGKAEAEARGAFLRAEADGLEAKIKKTGVSGETIVAAEVASDAFKHADTIIAGASGGMADLLGTIPAVKAAWERNRKDGKEAA